MTDFPWASEDEFHVDVWKFLNRAVYEGALLTSHENRQNGAAEGLRRKRRGVIAGWPDIEILHNGRSFFIELKKPKGVVSPAQKEVHKAITANGFLVKVCRSMHEVESVLREWGIFDERRFIARTEAISCYHSRRL